MAAAWAAWAAWTSRPRSFARMRPARRGVFIFGAVSCAGMRALIAALVVLLASPARADAPLPDTPTRLMTLGRVWAEAKFFHPTLQTKDIDWDAALVAAIPKVEAAKTQKELDAAVQSMLAVIGDPVTRVLDDKPVDIAAPADWLVTANHVTEVKLSVFAAGTLDFKGSREKATQIATEAAGAKVMIIDLRNVTARAWVSRWIVEQFASVLPAIDEWPLMRSVEHRGWRTQQGTTSGNYFSTFIVTGGRPPKPAPKQGPAHVVFVADPTAGLPMEALALQATGKATIVAQGALRDDAIVDTATIELGGGSRAQVRLNELLSGPPTADISVPAGQDPMVRARQLAKTLAKKLPAAKRTRPKPRELPQLRVRDDDDYASTPLPSREHRLLAGIRMWAVIDRFEPYRYLIKDWDGVLREMLPRLDAARDRETYLRVLKEMAARVDDGHVNVFPGAPDPTAKPKGIAPFEVRLVENRPTIVRLLDAAATAKLGVAVGDVIEMIDGKPAAETFAARRAITSGSTTESRDQRAAAYMLTGDDGTQVKLGVRGARGKLRDVVVTRAKSYAAAFDAPSSEPHWKKLAGNIGYIDLRTLTVPEVPAAMKDLDGTKAIVFDMRGYPNGVAWSLAPRLNTRGAKYGAQFLAPHVFGMLADDEVADTRTRFLQKLPPLEPGTTIYRGKVIVVIDDRAISQSEHTCLFLQEAAGATFVGSPTHGANGDVTVMRLPGGLRMSFTGQEVRHVDGKQLQQVGITPHIVIRPTLAGVRAGKDEVLDRAIELAIKGR
ncbi:MAG TPA: S41 family peptidase [Kofleriaceae bacterium]|nr:S41 family peptidase [Kofleriaceae bacterium]